MELLHNIINISYNIITFIYFVFFCYCIYLKIAKKILLSLWRQLTIVKNYLYGLVCFCVLR